jgi:hypothetical protein
LFIVITSAEPFLPRTLLATEHSEWPLRSFTAAGRRPADFASTSIAGRGGGRLTASGAVLEFVKEKPDGEILDPEVTNDSAHAITSKD